MAKIKWKVSEVPNGFYRSFSKRGWPYGDINDEPAFYIGCEEAYVPSNARTGNHMALKLSFADHRQKTFGYTWMTFKKRFATLQEAKDFAQGFADRNPEIFVNRD